ncbi:MAG: class A sortase [Lactococcus lactis]
MIKVKFLRLLSYLVVFVGLFLLVLPQLNQFRIDNRAKKNNAVAEEISATDMQNNINSKTSFDFDSIEEISTSGTWLSPDLIDQNLIIGRLYIPSIDLNLTVFNGLSNSILLAGLGTMRPGLTMGQGNFPIAGHYSADSDILFGNLISVEIGDKIYLTDNEKIYEYKVYETRIVDVTEVKWVENTVAKEHGKPIISLMNCYYVDGQNSGDRYFVFGELIEISDLADSPIYLK